MRESTMSVMGLYQWDNTIFDLMQIPEALEKQTLVDNLLVETAELEVLYTNPTVLKSLIGVWSAKEIDIWERLYATTQYEYNPIENYDRTEEGSTGGSGSTTHSGTDTNTEGTMFGGTNGRTQATMHGGQDTEAIMNGGQDTEAIMTHGELGGSDEVVGEAEKSHYVGAFNSVGSGSSDGLVKQVRDEDDATTTTNYGKEEDGTSNRTTTFGSTSNKTNTFGQTENINETYTFGQTINKTGSLQHGEKIVNETEGSHSLRAHGNIGVTTTQEMIEQQRRVERFNIYDTIIEDFKMRFCIMVY